MDDNWLNDDKRVERVKFWQVLSDGNYFLSARASFTLNYSSGINSRCCSSLLRSDNKIDEEKRISQGYASE